MRVPITVARIVARKAAPKSIPASDRMAGLTAIINAIVRKVLAPARISVVGVVPWSDRRKRRLSIAGGILIYTR
jgi:hypothetical protein